MGWITFARLKRSLPCSTSHISDLRRATVWHRSTSCNSFFFSLTDMPLFVWKFLLALLSFDCLTELLLRQKPVMWRSTNVSQITWYKCQSDVSLPRYDIHITLNSLLYSRLLKWSFEPQIDVVAVSCMNAQCAGCSSGRYCDADRSARACGEYDWDKRSS